MRMRRAAIIAMFLVGCGGGGNGGSIDGGPGPDPDGAADLIDAAGDPPFDAGVYDPLQDIGEVELVDDGYQFLEGPQWNPATATLLFSDIPASTIYELAPPSTITVFRDPSGNSNGLAIDQDGLLLAAEHGNRRVSRTLANGDVVTVADSIGGQSLNSPNDIAVRSDGTIYFTDPPYGISGGQMELSYVGVFRVDPSGTLTAERMYDVNARPNGVALSPDEETLYVTDTTGAVVRAFDVAKDGSLSNERTLVPQIPNPDGMAVDQAGNLFVTSADGVEVFAPDGTAWGTISVPMQPANCAFGDADGRTLYITAREGLYRVRLAHGGPPR
jgi:gluconolactonase